MKNLTIFLVLATICAGAYGQQIENTGNLFPEFRDGTINRVSGKDFNGKINYDLTTGKILFIHSGQPLTLENPEVVTNVIIDGRQFIPVGNIGFMEKMAVDNHRSLYVKWEGTVKSLNAASNSGYGASAPSTKVDEMHITEDGRANTLSGSSHEVAYKNTYFIVQDGQYAPFKNAKGLIKLFPENKSLIREYAADLNTDFKDPYSVRSLLVALGDKLEYQ
ncbi:MAG: hypothetical protein LIO77_04295 [Rikenellaceae bacterium]|nr:hypothetical protein [Rikenellaceae bacterium]